MIPQNHTLVPVPLSATSEETLKAYAKIFANSLGADAPLAGIELPELTSAIAHRRDHFSRRAARRSETKTTTSAASSPPSATSPRETARPR